MEKMEVTTKPKIELSLVQAEEVVRAEMLWHLKYMEPDEKKVNKAIKRVLKYYSTAEQYTKCMAQLEDK